MMKNSVWIFGVLLIALANGIVTQELHGQELTDAQSKFFEAKIRPALVKYCYECHSADEGVSRGGLLVDTRLGLLQGGDGGPAIVPGDLDESLFWEAITWEGYEMPPSQKMPDDVIADFKKWIEIGAPDPRERKIHSFKTKITKEDIEKGKEHWSFQPPKPQPNASIDRLVDATLTEKGLQPSEAADPFTLLRRLNYDLIGIPPSPEEIKSFYRELNDDAEAALQNKVDELLKSPQFGERWGRHWLDVARYAESSGSRNVNYPHAWRYRDYVIDSFNDDTPYNRFISEQVAGDLLPVKTDKQWQENLIATGFLAIGMKHQDKKNPREFMADLVDEQIDTMTQAVLGLTVACARCHDHKYDPIPTDDYYSLAGIFYSTKTYYGTSRIAQNHRPSDLILLPIQDKSSGGAQSRQALASLKERIASLDRQMRGVTGKERRGLRNTRNRLASQVAALNPDGSSKSFSMGVQDSDEMVNTSILLGGELEKPAQQVTRGFVQILGDLNFTVDSNKSSGRLKLAESLTSKSNPLTARVMANRIWSHLLGRPLVGTPNNFGFSGMEPENQQLLDYLAVRFMDRNWSVKKLIREIVLSKTYQRSSTYNASNYAVDPDNKFLWRANPRVLDAEAMRDSILAMSGQLNLEPPRGSVVSGGGGRPNSLSLDSQNPFRSVYLPIVRDNVPAALDLFDFPDPNISSAGRSESIVPTQALFVMNGDFVTAQAQAMAARLEEKYSSVEDQIRYAFAWAYGRPATDEELKISAQFFREFKPASPPRSPSDSANNQRPQRGKGMGGKGKGMGGKGKGMGKAGGRKAGGRGGPQAGGRGGVATLPKISAANQTLAVFCQTLMASARFRIVN